MSESMLNIIISTVKKGNGDKETLTGVKKLNAGLKELTGISLGSVTTLGLAGAAVGGLTKFVKDSIGGTIEYATQIDNMSRLLGISTEDTSRLVQASDDLFISQEKLKASLEAATRQGIDVSIEGLKKLSEQYLTLPEGVERSEWVLKHFGRSGAEMGKLMEIGAAGIDEATAAIADNMVITGRSMNEIMNFKRSLDNLNDSWAGLTYTVGTEVVPELDLFIRMITDGGDEITKMKLKAWRLEEGMFGLMGMFEGNREKAELLRDQINWLTGDYEKNGAGASDFYSGLVNGYGGVEGAIAALSGVTPVIEPLEAKLGNITQHFQLLTEQMIFNKLAANMTESAALALSVQMGLLDPTTYSLSLKMDELTDKYDLNRDGIIDNKEATAEYYEEVKKLQDQVNNLQSKTIDIVVNWRGEGGGIAGAENALHVDLNGNGIIGAANGLNFMVPPGFPNDSFGPIFVQSGEKVQVTPAGKSGGGNNINIIVNGAGDPKTVANEVMRKLRLQGVA